MPLRNRKLLAVLSTLLLGPSLASDGPAAADGPRERTLERDDVAIDPLDERERAPVDEPEPVSSPSPSSRDQTGAALHELHELDDAETDGRALWGFSPSPSSWSPSPWSPSPWSPSPWSPSPYISEDCSDTAGQAVGEYGYTCDVWDSNPHWCEYSFYYDDADFTADNMCCACGGGVSDCSDTAGQAVGEYGYTCDVWDSNPHWCDYSYYYDDADFTADNMCCACGGGVSSADTYVDVAIEVGAFVSITVPLWSSASDQHWRVDFHAGNDILLHFNTRYYEGAVVRNALLGGAWGAEERSLPAGGVPFSASTGGTLDFRRAASAWEVTLNGQRVPEFDFQHRASSVPLGVSTSLTGATVLIKQAGWELEHVTLSGSTFTKTSGTDASYDANAVYTYPVNAVSFQVGQTDNHVRVQLHPSLDAARQATEDAPVMAGFFPDGRVWAPGAGYDVTGAYDTDDVLTITAVGGNPHLYKGSELLCTWSEVSDTWYLKLWLYQNSATIANVGTSARTYAAGPDVSNSAYQSGSCDSWTGTLAEAQSRCDQDGGCMVLHDYDCDGENWRFCREGTTLDQMLDVGGARSACTRVVQDCAVEQIERHPAVTWTNPFGSCDTTRGSGAECYLSSSVTEADLVFDRGQVGYVDSVSFQAWFNTEFSWEIQHKPKDGDSWTTVVSGSISGCCNKEVDRDVQTWTRFVRIRLSNVGGFHDGYWGFRSQTKVLGCRPQAVYWYGWVTGACSADSETQCVRSANYPSSYGNNEQCTIAVDTASPSVIEATSFSTESGFDFLYINGGGYDGTSGPSAVTPTTSITWSSDLFDTDAGWELCPLGPCDVTNGSGLSSAYPCVCGSSACHVNEVCVASSSSCTPEPCSVRNGSSLSDLHHDSYPCSCGASTCSNSYEQCTEATSTCAPVAPVRLVDGPNAWTGRLEVYYDGQWGTACSDYFYDDEAAVVCRELGYPGGRAVYYTAYGEGSGPTWLEDVACSGNESTLASCGHHGFGYQWCYWDDDMAVQCEGPCDATDGSGLSSQYPCTCSSATCVANEVCTAGSSDCAKLPCTVKDGSSNSDAYPCLCGASVCSDYEFCSEADNTCATVTTEHEYDTFVGDCRDTNGYYTYIAHYGPGGSFGGAGSDVCESACNSIHSHCEGYTVDTYGECQWLWVTVVQHAWDQNWGGASPDPIVGGDGDGYYTCHRRKPAPCSPSDGSTAIAAYPCSCGNATCYGGHESCAGATSTCAPAPCSVTDGSSISDSYPCTCSNTTCASIMEICDAASFACIPVPTATETSTATQTSTATETSTTTATETFTAIRAGVVSGSATFQVADAASMVQDEAAWIAFRNTYAELGGAPASWVVVELWVGRRLAGARGLTADSLVVAYEVTVASSAELAANEVSAALGAVNASELAAEAGQQLVEQGADAASQQLWVSSMEAPAVTQITQTATSLTRVSTTATGTLTTATSSSATGTPTEATTPTAGPSSETTAAPIRISVEGEVEIENAGAVAPAAARLALALAAAALVRGR